MGEYRERVVGAFRLVFAGRGYRLLFLALFAAFLAFYLLVLPAAYTGGRIGLVALPFLTPTLAFFSVLLSLLVGLSLTFAVYGFRSAARLSGKGTGLVSVAASVLPGLLCCTPVVPTLLALLGASATTIFAVGGRIQGIFATYERHILTAAALLLLYALHRNVLQVWSACPADRRTAAHGRARAA